VTCIATAAGIVAAERRPDERVAENLGEEVLGALEVTARHVELDEPARGMATELINMLDAREPECRDAHLVVDA
jgi:hypothetical protein